MDWACDLCFVIHFCQDYLVQHCQCLFHTQSPIYGETAQQRLILYENFDFHILHFTLHLHC